MKHLLAIAALLFACSANGATYYYSDCEAGAHADCVVGSDTNDGLTPETPFKSLTKFISTSTAHTRLFAKGGAWTITGVVSYYLPAGTAANPNVWSTYTPSWGPGTEPPILTFLNNASNKSGFELNEGTAPNKDEGYTFQGLEMRGPGYRADGATVAGTGHGEGFAFSIRNDVDHVILDNMTISGFVVGISLSGTDLLYTPAAGANHKNEYFTLKNSYLFNNSGQGWLGGGWYVTVENNVFANNGFTRDTLDHNIYIATSNRTSGLDENGNEIPWGGAHMVFRGNYMTKSNFNGTTCNASSFVGHYRAYDVVIENNVVNEPASGSGCFGIDMTVLNFSSSPYSHAGTVIRGNRVNLGNAGIGIRATGCLNCIIEDNVVVREGTGGFTGIAIADENSSAINGPDGFGIIRNNAIYINTNSTGAEGIRAKSTVSSGETIVSNLIVFGPSSNALAECFEVGTRTAASYTAFNNNLCYRAAGAPKWSNAYSTRLAAQGAGFDLNSLESDPLLTAVPAEANDWSMSVQTGSPAINAGHTTLSSRRAIDSKVPVGARDIGAHDFGATVVAPATPTRLEIN